MKKTTKVVLGSAMTMAMCASLIAGSTLALFSSEDSVNIAVTSGKVDVKAEIVENPTIASTLGDHTALGAIGVEDNKVVLTNFAPGDYADIGIKVTNFSSIAVKWQLMVSLGEDSNVDLYKAMDFEVTSEDYTDLKLVDLTNNRKETKWYALSAAPEAGEEVTTLKVHVAFPEEAEGEALMEKDCTIVLAVNATQGNAHTADPVATAYNVTDAADLTGLTSDQAASISEINLLNDLDIKEGDALANFEQLEGFTGTFNGNGFTITYAGNTDPEEFLYGLTAEQGPKTKAIALEADDIVPPTVKDLTVRNAVSFGKKVTWDKNGDKTRVFQVNDVEGLKYFRDLVNSTDNTNNNTANLWGKNQYPFTGETVELTADIDLDNQLFWRIGVVGTNYQKFGGTFNGNGYEIKNVKVASTQAEDVAQTMEIGEIFYTLNNDGTTLVQVPSTTTALTDDAVLNYTVHNEGDLEQIYTWKGYKNGFATSNNNYDIGGERTWIVNTAAGLALFRDRVNGVAKYRSYQYDVVKLGADITLEDGEGEANWVRINSTGFTGVFDGQGYEIKNVKVANSATDPTKFQEWGQVFQNYGNAATIDYTVHNEGDFEQISHYTKAKGETMYADHQWYINSAEGFKKFAAIESSNDNYNTEGRGDKPVGYNFWFQPTFANVNGASVMTVCHTINLAADINVGEYEYFNYYLNGSTWSGRTFGGIFNGHGHTIFYTNVARPGSAEMGRLIPQNNLGSYGTRVDNVYPYTAKIMNLEMAVSGEFADKLGSYVSVYDANGNFTPAKWSLTTAQHLMNFRDLVNGGRTFTGETVEIANDIDVSSANWVGIGTKEHPFMGTFNGNGHTVKYKIGAPSSVYTMKDTDHILSFFGVICAAAIEHFNVDGSIVVKGALDTGGKSQAEYCYYFSGLVGWNSSSGKGSATIERCSSNVDIDISQITLKKNGTNISLTATGILAHSDASCTYISDCVNYGNISLMSEETAVQNRIKAQVGGIGTQAGGITKSSAYMKLTNVINCGTMPNNSNSIISGQIACVYFTDADKNTDSPMKGFYCFNDAQEAYGSTYYELMPNPAFEPSVEIVAFTKDNLSEEVFSTLDFVNVWKMTSDGPVLR